MRAFDAICATEWLMTESALRAVLAIANRENTDYQAVATQTGARLDYTRTVEMRGTTAVIPIQGPMFRYANLMTEMSGATSVATIAKDFTAALQNPAVKSILLDIDSPGGQAQGIGELAGIIAAGRGQKPIEAYIGGYGCSAAYWIAAAADALTVDAMAVVGCLGAVSTVPDPERTTSHQIEFVSSQTPRKRADPRTEAGRTDIQRTVDSMAEVFLQDVARLRGTTYETVCDQYGQGGVFVGQEAVDAGMVDHVGTFEGVVSRLNNAQRPAIAPQRVAAHGGGPMSLMDKWREFTANLTPEDLRLEGPAPTPTPEPTPPPPSATGLPSGNPLLAASPPAGMTEEEAAHVRALSEENIALQARVAQLEADKRDARFRDMVLGKGGEGDGAAWLGTAESHLTILQALAAAEGGEESPAFLTYCQEQRALAAQEREAKRLASLQQTYGKGPAPASTVLTGSAMAEIDAKVATYQTEHPGTARGDALQAIIKAEPALYARYQQERRKQIPGVVEVGS
jgi:ClpP class serine protease